MDLGPVRIADWPQLRDYCYHVASVVGLMMARIFELRDEAGRERAVDLGIAMQLTNILRDVGEDFGMGRVYLPADEMASAGVGVESLALDRVTDDLRNLLRAQAARAREYYLRAEAGIPLLADDGSQFTVWLMRHVYAGILDEVEKARLRSPPTTRENLVCAQVRPRRPRVARLPAHPPPPAMIPARKSAAFNYVLRRWLDRTLRRRFHNVYLGGAEHLRALDPGRPVVGCVNHTNWWDGFVLYVLSYRLLPHDIHLAMEEKNLRRYRFFTWMGVFGLDLATRASALPGMRYAVRLLREKTSGGRARLAWMFVQGRLLPAGAKVEVKPGALFLARRAGACLLPVVLRYEWLSESRPSIFVQVGAPMNPSTSAEELAVALHSLLTRVGEALEPLDLGGFIPLHGSRLSMNKRWDWFLHLLGRRREKFDEHNR